MKVQKSHAIPALALAAIVGLVAIGSTIIGSDPNPEAGRSESAASPAGPADVIYLHGLRGIEFGASEQELTRQGALLPQTAGCAPRLTNLATVSPVFVEDRLVLMWASPPMRTPEGIAVGTSIDEVRRTYPDLAVLDAPHGSYRFDGLLTTDDDLAYLFLHDGRMVRKIVAGYAEFARKLFDEGFGTC